MATSIASTKPSLRSAFSRRWQGFTSSSHSSRNAMVPDLHRGPSNQEQAVIDKLSDILLPATLEPFLGYQPATSDGNSPSSGSLVQVQIAERMLNSARSFVEQLPHKLPLSTSSASNATAITLLHTLALREQGQTYKAVCALSELIETKLDDSHLARLHLADALVELGLRGMEDSRWPRYDSLTADPNLVNVALLMLLDEQALVGGLLKSSNLKASVSDGAQEKMFDSSIKACSSDEVYAMIRYCHSAVSCYRFACLTRSPHRLTLEPIADNARQRLLHLWHQRDKGLALAGIQFLKWRCTRALEDCFPFGFAALGLPVRPSLFTYLCVSEQSALPAELPRTTAASGQLSPLSDLQMEQLSVRLDFLIERNDFRGIEECLCAVLLLGNTALSPIEQELRRLWWQLHAHMLPRRPWVLDGMLLHRLSLWLGTQRLDGQILGARQSPRHEMQPVSRSSHLSRLQFGFDRIETTDDAVRFLYRWSILYCCMQYTPAPLNDKVYQLLFLHQSVFSWSQLCERVRQAHSFCVARGVIFDGLNLDGSHPFQRHIAGCGSLVLPRADEDPIEYLQKEISGLDGLLKETQSIAQTMAADLSQGLQHLQGFCLVWKGQAREDRGREISGTLKSVPDSAPSSKDASKTDLVLAELLEAKRLFEEALEKGRTLKLSTVTRHAGDGLLRIHDPLHDLLTAQQNPVALPERSRSLFKLCERLQNDLRSASIQTLGTPYYVHQLAVSDLTSIFSTSSTRPSTDLYQDGARALQNMDAFDEAMWWRNMESQDEAQAFRLHSLHTVARRSQPRSDSAQLFSASELTTEHLGCMQSALATRRAPAQASPAALFWSLSETLGDVAIVQYVMEKRDGLRSIHIYLRTSTFQGQVNCLLKPADLDKHMPFTIPASNQWEVDADSLLRELDNLVSGLEGLISPDQLLLIDPGSVCRGIPIHALRLATTTVLIDHNPIVYVPDFAIFEQCVEKALQPRRASRKEWTATAATVVEYLEKNASAAALYKAQYQLGAAVQHVAQCIGGTTLLLSEVVKQTLQRAFERDDFVLFIGHAGGGSAAPGDEPCLELHDGEEFTDTHIATLELPASQLYLLGCSTGLARLDLDTERNLMRACLLSGCATVVGTMFEAEIPAADTFARAIADHLGPALQNGNHLFDLARAFQGSIKTMRKDGKARVAAWAPFMLQGSPIIALWLATARSSSSS